MHKTGELEINDFKNIDKKSKKESITVFTGVVLVILVMIFMGYIILR